MAPINLDSTAAKAFEDEMRLTFAEKRIHDLKKQLCAEYERAQKAERRADEAQKLIPNADLDVMRAMRQQLLLANEEKKAALAARDKAMEEAKQAKLESKHLREELQKSQPTIKKLTGDLHEARSSRPTLDHTAVNQLHTTITARDAKIEQLVDKYETLATKHFDVLSQANKHSEENQSYQVKNEKQAVELKDLSTKLAAAESARDRYRKGYTELLARGTQAVSQPQATNLNTENAKLKTDIQDLNKKIRDLKWDIGFYITDMDLAAADMRVFTCRHRSFRDIPDGAHSTREKHARVIASDFFHEYQYDDEFVQEYNKARAFTLDHHRAHEAINQGRADWASNLKAELERVDTGRGVSITYR